MNQLPPEGIPAAMPQHSVVVYFNYGLPDIEPYHELSLALLAALDDSDIGYMDGREINMDLSDGSYYFYGPNAEVLFKAVEPLLCSYAFLDKAVAVLRFGEPGKDAPEIDIDLHYKPLQPSGPRRIVLDGERIHNMADFWREWARQIDPASAQYFGRNFDAFRDAILGGGPGHPDECRIIFRNQVALQRAIGAEATAWLMVLFQQGQGMEMVFES